MSILAPSARLVGNRISRKEDPRLLTGRGRYVDDVVVPGMLHVAFARSDIARGRIVGVDVAAAREAHGVVAVLTAVDLNHVLVGPMGATPVLSMGPPGPNKVLADDEVRYVGDPYTLVVAKTRALAEDALELIELDVEPLPPVVDYTTALESSERVHPETDSNVAGAMPMPPDDELRAIFESAPHVLTEHYVQNRYLAVPMETRGIVASWQPHAGSFDVFVSTQSPHDVRTVTSRITGVPESRIRVQMGDVGGGFGQKAYLARDEQIVVLASYHLGKPLKWIEDRRENLLAATTSRAECCTVTVAADQEGKILGIGADHLDEVGAYPQAGSAAAMGAVIFTGPYRIPKLAFESRSAFTNTCSRAPYRGPWQFETYFREQAVDSLARKLGMDPLELRRRNVLQRDELPYTLPLGHPPVRRVAGRNARASRIDGRLRRVPRVATGAARGRSPPGGGHRPVHRAAEHDRAVQHRTRAHPNPTRRHRGRVPRLRIARARSGDHDRATRQRVPRCAVRRHLGASRRHQRDAVRVRDGR